MSRLKFLSHIMVVLLLELLTGCNGGVFVDEPPLDDSVDLFIDGDGGEANVNIPLDGLENIKLDMMGSSEKYCTYYDIKGNVADKNISASDLGRIVYESNFSKFVITKNGRQLKIESVCQCNETDMIQSVRLEYSYGARFIDIHISPGKPLKLLRTEYFDSIKIDEKVITYKYKFTNAGPIPQTFNVRPYLNEVPVIIVMPVYAVSWIVGRNLTMEVPKYIDGQWDMVMTDNIFPDVKYVYPGPDRDTKVPIEVAPEASGSVYVDVIYTQAVGNGKLVFVNEILDREINEAFSVTSRYPIDYKIRIENAE